MSTSYPNKQRGAVTLLVAIVVLMMMLVMSLTTAKVSLMESKITGNDLRAREAQEAAEAGLERGVAWAKENSITTSINCTSAGTAPCPDSMEVVTGATTGDTYDYDISYVVDSTSVQVISTATGVTDSNVTATAETWVRQIRVELFDSGMTVPPPLVTSGCVTNTTGTPDIYLLDENNPAVLSATSSDPSCLQQGHFDVNTWSDEDGNGFKNTDDTTGNVASDVSGELNAEQRGTFTCGSGNCSWDAFF
jgi:Tfp pilus assembly protein PilX